MEEEQKIIALAGNPNVGKSTIFNGLTGLKQHTGNYVLVVSNKAGPKTRYPPKVSKLQRNRSKLQRTINFVTS